MKRDEWYYKALEFIKAKKFTNVGGYDNERYCCLKFRDPNGDMSKKFGLISGDDNLTVWLRNKKGELTGEFERFSSVEELLDAGWDVD